MNGFRQVISPILARFGVNPKHYWLLMDLFRMVSERREVLGQLGQDTGALKAVAWVYCGLSALMAVFMVMAQVNPLMYMAIFVGYSGFMLFTVIMVETGNSLVNPAEGLVLAHQPVTGATYTAAKLSHLLRIVFYLTLGLNLAPALMALLLDKVSWLYPLQHLGAAFVVGLLDALLCCAFYGWLLRFVPAHRAKAVAQYADALPWILIMGMQNFRLLLAKQLPKLPLPANANALLALKVCAFVAAVAIIVFGLRSLSADYLVKVASIAHGGSSRKASVRPSLLGKLVTRWFGGPPGLAGFEYTRRMMVRDWQFRKMLLGLLPTLMMSFVLLWRDWRKSPFDTEFSGVHLVPHAVGFLLFMICVALPYGGGFKCNWVFLIAPSPVFNRFARGVWALLWLRAVLIPHLFLVAVWCWTWGPQQGGLFVAFSLALSTLYLGLVLRLVDGVPFGKQSDSRRGAQLLPLMIAGGFGIAAAVALQHFVLFRWPVVVLATTPFIAFVAWGLTKSSLAAVADAIRFALGLESQEVGSGYIEL